MLEVIKQGTEEERSKLPTMNGKYYTVLDPVNSYFRRLLYQEIAKQYGSRLSVVKLEEDNKVGCIV